MDASSAGSPGAWGALPADMLLMVEACLSLEPAEAGSPNHLASMRACCQAWRAALAVAAPALQPLGKPAALAAFPCASALDYAARGATQSLTDADLAAACTQLGPGLQALDISGVFQLTSGGLAAALRACPALLRLSADGSTLQDAAFAAALHPQGALQPGRRQQTAALGASSSGGGSRGTGAGLPTLTASLAPPPLRRLESLSLRGCLFLRGSLLDDLAEGCPALASLDLAGCCLAFNLDPGCAAPLARMQSLQRLVLDGNGVDDAAMQHVAAVPRLRELSVRGSTHLSDAALHVLAQRRGSSLRRTASDGASSSSSSSSATGGSSSSSVDVGLVSLDISGCTGLTDQCWLAIVEMQGLTCLRMEHMTHLLQFPSMPEALPGALWHLPRLRALSLAGSCCHPSKLKLLAAVCGSSVIHLDIGTGGTRLGVDSGWGSPPGSPRSSSGSAGAAPWVAGAGPQALPAQPPGPAYRRLTSLHERDLCEAAQSFRQLQSFSAAGSALPLRVVTAFLEAAPAGRLTRLDLGGCCLEADPPAAASAHSTQPPWQQQLFFSSGARRALNFDSFPAVTGTSASRLQQLHAEADSWQRPATAGRFAAALRRQGPSLISLRLDGASGVTDRHLASLSSLKALTQLCLAGTGGAVSATLLAEAAAGCRRLQELDISGSAADDACLAAAAAMPRLRLLSAAGCGNVGAGAGAAALAAGPAAEMQRWLDLSGTAVDEAAAAALAAGCRQLRGVNLTGCQSLTPAGVERLSQLPRLSCLGLGRCPQAVTDAGLLQLARSCPQLTWLNLSEAHQLTAGGLAAALGLLPCLAHLDLTAASNEQLADEQLVGLLAGHGGARAATAANVQLPQGGTSPTGSPFKRRAAAAAVPA